MQNPFGAVPRALENSRLALRDIMSDYLATKTMDANMNLMMKKAETENAMVGANLERARMGQELDLAKMAQGQQNWQQGFDLQKKESEDNRNFREKEFTLKQAADRRAAAFAAQRNEVRTGAEWLKLYGGTRRSAQRLGIDLNQKYTRTDAEHLASRLKSAYAEHKSLEFWDTAADQKDEIARLDEQLKNKNLTPKQTEILEKQRDKAKKLFYELDTLIMKVEQPSPEKVLAAKHREWNEYPALQQQFRDFNAYSEDFDKKILNARSEFHKDAEILKAKDREYETSKALEAIDPNFDEKMQQAKATIQASGHPKAGAILRETQRLFSTGDIAKGFDYAQKWNNYLQQSGTTAAGANNTNKNKTVSFNEGIAREHAEDKAWTSAAGVNVRPRNIAETLGLINDPKTQLSAIDRDWKAGLMSDQQHEEIRNKVLSRIAARQ